MAPIEDIVVLSLSTFLGTFGVSLTGFGMAIVYLFAYQIISLAGYDGNFKYAVFIQALALFSAQPLLLHKAEVRKHASWKMLRYFIPITIISTPLGQITGSRVATEMVQAVGGCLVTYVAIFEMYQKRALFVNFLQKYFCRRNITSDVVDDPSKSHQPSLDKNQTARLTLLGSSDASRDSLNENSLAADADMDLDLTVPGTFDEKFVLGAKLGEGAFSVVKQGTNKYSKKTFAIKIVDKASLLDAEESRLQEEIAILRELKHDNILGLRDFYDEPGNYYLVMDVMAGGDLLARLDEISFFHEVEARRITKLVLDAVQYIHDKKIAHRDLKPENILLASDQPNAQLKIADFGFAKKEVRPNSFVTMCGTPAYVAPEILRGLPYGCNVDMWSVAVIVWAMLAGYQPFRGDNEQELQIAIKNGAYVFEPEFWQFISDEAKGFISKLLVADPTRRMSVKQAVADPWFDKSLGMAPPREDETKVFFMIGSQRSGSNWLRTMLDEREDLCGPHPPHIMRDFTLILDKFGELSDGENFRVLVDHVCTFVERNQVPWTDRHGSHLKFPRHYVYGLAVNSCIRVKKARATADNNNPLEKAIYLLSVFDAIMTYYAKANGKRLWMCKSMGMSKFHDLLLEYYGPERLRYIYLIRDPRDVAMSFMKTPVGDCHWHAIVTKWTNLQQHALRIMSECPELIHQLRYEDILKDKESVVKGVYEFIGERRFGGVKRQASVLCMHKTEDLIHGAKRGREAMKAHQLSYQFKNLGRGESFAKTQNQKWRDPETGLKTEELIILESVAHEMMAKLGYKTHLIGIAVKPAVWTEEELADFKRLNEEGIEQMNRDLAKENPGDMARRQHQAATLKLAPTLIQPWEDDGADPDLDASTNSSLQASIKNFLNEKEFEARLQIEPERWHVSANGLRFRWGVGSQRGYYPDQHDKPNQDDRAIHIEILKGAAQTHWFGIFDGHGGDGHKCAQFARNHIPEEFKKNVVGGDSLHTAMEKAHMDVHNMLIATEEVDSEQSGTTATTVLVVDNKCIISNVGDSTAILGWESSPFKTSARFLCTEHTPKRADERERIKRAGGVVMTADQRDGLAPMHENWSDHEAPPRIWSVENDKFPGCCFSRSIGDGIAHTLGVTARPEFFEHEITFQDRVLILATDGITEFMDAEKCVEIACGYKDPADAAKALIREASDRWTSQGDYMDDITAIVIFFDSGEGDEEIIFDTGDIEEGGFKLHTLAESDETEAVDKATIPLGQWAIFLTLLAGFASGYLGGLCGIPGPPIIFYFLHPPYPVEFNKKSQRATGSCITCLNVVMRIAYYLVDTFIFDEKSSFTGSDWLLYLCVILSSWGGVFVGSEVFERMKDSRDTIRMILSLFLLLCGVSLLLSSFAKGL